MLGVEARCKAIPHNDTLTILRERAPLKIRLANIDAPEKKQPFGTRSRQSLATLCFGKEATFKQQSRDRYGRIVAIVYCDGVNVNRKQVELGLAWVYLKYNADRSLPLVELAARLGGYGLWSDSHPIPPWEYRRARTARIHYTTAP